jgi:hypothetical protein
LEVDLKQTVWFELSYFDDVNDLPIEKIHAGSTVNFELIMKVYREKVFTAVSEYKEKRRDGK